MSFVLALIGIWGFLTDADTFRDMPAAKVRIWTLQRLEDLLRHSVKMTETDMDQAADIFVGGPLIGLVPALFNG